MDQKSPERYEQDMIDTRRSLTDKVAALENQVVGTLQGATTAVQDTVASVKWAVKDSVSTVKTSVSDMSQSMKSTFDLADHVRQRPWSMVLGAAVSGLITGLVVSKSRTPSYSSDYAVSRLSSSPPPPTAPTAPRQPGIFDDVFDAVKRELRVVSEAAVAKLGSSLKEFVDDGIRRMAERASLSHDKEPEGVDRPYSKSRVNNGAACAIR